ncbi:MAG: hypothetical protein FJ040_07195 [Chloroflexi bacterium]|nr:hypothetical protein [Chloroflexota bacterium]
MTMHLRPDNQSNITGCCFIGIFLVIFYAIWNVIKVVARGIWYIAKYFAIIIYYMVAWPILLVGYLWRRGGLYRVASLLFFIVIVMSTVISVIISPDAPPRTTTRATDVPQVSATAEATSQPTATPPNATATPVPTATREATAVPTAQPTAVPTTRPASGSLPLPTSSLTSGITRPADTIPARVVRVIDGDTVVVNINDEETRLRLIGIDTPESVDPRKPVECFGIEASAYTKALLLSKNVYLEPDPTQDETDRYDRLLVYLWIDDTTLFNHKIIADGYAFEYTYQIPYQYQTLFKAAQQDARTNQYGLWSPTTCNGDPDAPSTASVPQQLPTATVAPTATMTADAQAFPCQVGQIKANPNSGIYHLPTGQGYAQTRNDRVICFGDEDAAKQAGFRKSSR